MLQLQVTCGIQNQRQEVYCALLHHTRLFTIKKHTAVSHCSAESQIISLDAGSRMEGLQAVEFWEVWDTLSSKSDKGNHERSKRERVNPSHSQSDNCVFLSPLTTFRPTFRAAPTQPNVTFSKAVIQMINRGRSPNLRHVTRTHRVELVWIILF